MLLQLLGDDAELKLGMVDAKLLQLLLFLVGLFGVMHKGWRLVDGLLGDSNWLRGLCNDLDSNAQSTAGLGNMKLPLKLCEVMHCCFLDGLLGHSGSLLGLSANWIVLLRICRARGLDV